ncbi:hypothetical protein E2320_009397 [Naja naja]|nr:hypothetical protein E2320_009397 [Naja naja]
MGLGSSAGLGAAAPPTGRSRRNVSMLYCTPSIILRNSGGRWRWVSPRPSRDGQRSTLSQKGPPAKDGAPPPTHTHGSTPQLPWMQPP